MATAADMINNIEKISNNGSLSVVKESQIVQDKITAFIRKTEINDFLPIIADVFNNKCTPTKNSILKLTYTFQTLSQGGTSNLKIVHRATSKLSTKLTHKEFKDILNKFFFLQFSYIPADKSVAAEESTMVLKMTDIATKGKGFYLDGSGTKIPTGTTGTSGTTGSTVSEIFGDSKNMLWALFAMTDYTIMKEVNKGEITEAFFQILDNSLKVKIDGLYRSIVVDGWTIYDGQKNFTHTTKLNFGGRKSRSQKRSKKNSTKRRY